ncbi:hypothetical protein ACU4HD_13510 [Cupriavidus basilensis]
MDRNPTSTVDSENSQKKLLAIRPNSAGGSFRSAISGTATMPSTILSRKLISESQVSIEAMAQALRGWYDGSVVIGLPGGVAGCDGMFKKPA